MLSTNWDGNLVLLDDSGRVRSQITSVVCQIQRFDFECNPLVVTRKVIIRYIAARGFGFKSSILNSASDELSEVKSSNKFSSRVPVLHVSLGGFPFLKDVY
jgi:hypothetical protein